MEARTIKVFNYTPSFVGVSTQMRNIGLEPATDGVPTYDFFNYEEIEYINSQSPVFRTGALEFEEGMRDELYAKLAIPDWRERCLFERDIDDMILNPTMEKMKRIVDIKDSQTMERIRGHLARLMYRGQHVSIKVSDIINARFDELRRNIRESNIQITPKTVEAEVNQDTVNALQDQIAELKAMLQAQMQATIHQSQANAVEEAVEEMADEAVEEAVEEKPVVKPAAKPVKRTPVATKAPAKAPAKTTKTKAK